MYKWPLRHEKVLTIINHQGNANQNHNEMPLHTKRGSTIKTEKNKYWWGCGDLEPSYFVSDAETAALEDILVVPIKVKHGVTITPVDYVIPLLGVSYRCLAL
jgi:hypothetical protein